MRYILLATLLWILAPAARGQSALVQADTVSGWQLVFSNPSYSIGGLQFLPPNTVYATAYNGISLLLMRSNDEGLSWDTLATPVPVGITCFTSDMVGYSNSATSDSSYVWKTVDGGNSWVAHPRNANAPQAIAFSSRDTGVAIGVAEIARTTDGGETWNKVSPQSGASGPKSATFGDSRTGYYFGQSVFWGPPHNANAGFCQKTTDGGATWKDVFTGIPSDIYCSDAVDANTVVVGCISQYIAKTSNGGASWNSIAVAGTKTGFFATSFINKQHGLIVGNDDNTGINSHGVIYATDDSATTWHQQYVPNAPELYGVAMLSNSVALVCGGGNIYRTTTGGRPILGVRQEPTLNLSLRTFPNPTTNLLTVEYTLPTTESVSIRYFDVQGKTIGTVAARVQDAGTHQAVFDASKLASGTYYFQLTTAKGMAGGQFEVGK